MNWSRDGVLSMHVIIALLQCPHWQSTGGGWGVLSMLVIIALLQCPRWRSASPSSPLLPLSLASSSCLGQLWGKYKVQWNTWQVTMPSLRPEYFFFYLRQDHVHQWHKTCQQSLQIEPGMCVTEQTCTHGVQCLQTLKHKWTLNLIKI